jgi:malonyl-CoA/methylmalonyl-CoA synthetase
LNGSHAWARHLEDPTKDAEVLAGESLPRVWRTRWEETPNSIALVAIDGSSMTNEELEERSRVTAARLAATGLVAGDRIVFAARPSIAFVVAYVSAHRLGAVVVPLNTGYTLNEVRRVIESTKPSAAVVDSSEIARMVRVASEDRCVVLGLPVEGPESREPRLDQADRHTPALICHTSGTTGASKGAALTSGNLLASAEAVRLAWRWTPDDRLLLSLPLFHLHGLGVGIHGTLTAGASVLLFDGFDPSAIADAARRGGGSIFFGVPTMYHRIARSDAATAFTALRLCVSGSAPLPPDLHDAFGRQTGQRILERYGLTETVMNVSNPYEGERRPGSVGIPLPGVDVRVAGGGDQVPGEIEVRGPNVFSGYWNLDAATNNAFTADGWFRTGDIGRWDADGYLRIVGRSKELIISGGYNVYPGEVEDVLLSHPAVSEVAVVGRPSQEWGETVVAFVVSTESISSDELTSFAAERLASYKRPRRIEFISAIPRNDLGKVLRDQLLC